MPDQVIAKPRPIDNLRHLLTQPNVIAQVRMAVPRHLTPERVIRVTLTACQRNPELLECEPYSIVGCLIQASELGLELDGVLGQAYMVPFNNRKTGKKEAQFITGYRGLISLAKRAGDIIHFAAHVVREGDLFDYRYGTDAKVDHSPALDGRGKPIGVYALVRFKSGGCDFEVMGWNEAMEHGRKWSRTFNKGAWQDSPEEQAKKTVLRRLAKRCDMAVELQKAAILDERADEGLPQLLALPQALESSLPSPQGNGEGGDKEEEPAENGMEP
jgi:recombination protein RecT